VTQTQAKDCLRLVVGHCPWLRGLEGFLALFVHVHVRLREAVRPALQPGIVGGEVAVPYRRQQTCGTVGNRFEIESLDTAHRLSTASNCCCSRRRVWSALDFGDAQKPQSLLQSETTGQSSKAAQGQIYITD